MSTAASTTPRLTLRRRWFACLVTLAIAGVENSAFAEKLVTVRAVADSAYAKRRAAASPPKVETYVFAKGQYFPGITYDRTLDRMPFEWIAKSLAPDLQRQNFQPTKDIAKADLVIVVHWGVTLPNDRGAELMALDPDILRGAANEIEVARATEADDPLGNASALGAVAAAEAAYRFTTFSVASLYETDRSRSFSNAELLGFSSALGEEENKLFESAMARTLRSMVDEERYFIILEAYDGPRLRDGKKYRVWHSRLSIRAAGVNFRIALDRMSAAGAQSFGTRSEGLTFEYPTARQGTVEVGEIRVIGSEP